MRWIIRLARPITHPHLVVAGDLRRYVLRVVLWAMLLALALDVANQLMMFTTWPAALESWALTLLDSGLVALGIGVLVGRSQRDLTAAKRELEELSRTDVLTGLPNRRAIVDEVAARPGAVMMLVIADIDRFKSINDAHGHRSGDVVIRTVGQRMAGALAGADLVGRLGGEEFAVICAEPQIDGVLDALSRFRHDLSVTPILAGEAAITVTISAGVAVAEAGEPFDSLYSEADAALYRAKGAGRNSIVLSPRLERRLLHGRPQRAA